MSEDFQRKIDTIVSSIVSFKEKSNRIMVSESDISDNITESIAGLNDTGKLVVLDELSKVANENPDDLLTTTGETISVSKINEIVNEKIRSAEKEGLNLRIGEPVSKDNKLTLAEKTFALVAVNVLLNNFDILTPEQRGLLRENYESLNSEQRRKYDKGMLDKIKNSNLDDKKKKELTDFFEGDLHSCINNVLDILQKRYGTNNFNISNIAQSEILKIIEGLDISDELKKELKKYDFEELLAIDKGEQKLADWYLQLDKALSNGDLEEVKRLDKLIKEYEKSSQHQDYLKATGKELESKQEENIGQTSSQRKALENDEAKNNFQSAFDDKQLNEQAEDIDIEQTISQEIEQIPIALAKANFSPEQIQEALKKYKLILSSLTEDEVNKKNDDILDILYDKSDEMNLSESTEEILGIILPLTYSDEKNPYSLQEIFSNAEQKKEFFEHFDQVINQEQVQTQDVQITGELEEILEQYFEQSAVDMNVSAIEAQQEHIAEENQQEAQEQPESYSFINSEYLEQDSREGLIPRNGENSKALQDDKKAIFYSQGKEGAIVMYFEFMRKYDSLRGADGDEALQQYAAYQNGEIELSDEKLQLLQEQVKQVNQIKGSQSFDEFMGDKVYLKLGGIDMEVDKQEADQWREAHPGTRMNYNYANSWTASTIPPDRIDVVSLQSKDGTDVRTSQKDVITYFLSQTSVERIEALGVNDSTLKYIKDFYQEHGAEISQLGTKYQLVTQNIQEFEQGRESEESALSGKFNASGNIEASTTARSGDVQEAKKLAQSLSKELDSRVNGDNEEEKTSGENPVTMEM